MPANNTLDLNHISMLTDSFFEAVVLKDLNTTPRYKKRQSILRVLVPDLIKDPKGDNTHISNHPTFNAIAARTDVDAIKLLQGKRPCDAAFIHIRIKPVLSPEASP